MSWVGEKIGFLDKLISIASKEEQKKYSES